MLLNLLGKLQKELESYNLDFEKIKNLKEVLIFYRNGIVPSQVIKRELSISYEETHKLMILLMTKGLLKAKYKVFCENETTTGLSNTYDDPSEIPVSICDRCDKRCTMIKNLVVEFEVCI